MCSITCRYLVQSGYTRVLTSSSSEELLELLSHSCNMVRQAQGKAGLRVSYYARFGMIHSRQPRGKGIYRWLSQKHDPPMGNVVLFLLLRSNCEAKSRAGSRRRSGSKIPLDIATQSQWYRSLSQSVAGPICHHHLST